MSLNPEEWRFIFDIILMSLLLVLLLLTFAMLFLKRRNVPISQSIEVDPREPHSITITFVPSSLVIDNAPAVINNGAPVNDVNNTVEPEILRTVSVNHSQTASMA
jgi:hypothetical protein